MECTGGRTRHSHESIYSYDVRDGFIESDNLTRFADCAEHRMIVELSLIHLGHFVIQETFSSHFLAGDFCITRQ